MRTTLTLAVVLALGYPAPPAPGAGKGRVPSARLAGASRTTLGKAIEIALLKVPGEALRAEIEIDDATAVIEVTVFAHGRCSNVEIDGDTGAVLKVEEDDEDG